MSVKPMDEDLLKSILGGAVAYAVAYIVGFCILHVFIDPDPSIYFLSIQDLFGIKYPVFLGMIMGFGFEALVIGGASGWFAWEFGKWLAKQGVTFYLPPFFWGIYGGFLSAVIIIGISLT
jgi:hypothetical protein